MMKKTFQIQNLKCGGCENTIINALLKIDGVKKVSIHSDDSSISLTYKNDDAFKNARRRLSQIGYPIQGDVNTIVKQATSYVSCAIGKLSKQDYEDKKTD